MRKARGGVLGSKPNVLTVVDHVHPEARPPRRRDVRKRNIGDPETVPGLLWRGRCQGIVIQKNIGVWKAWMAAKDPPEVRQRLVRAAAEDDALHLSQQIPPG